MLTLSLLRHAKSSWDDPSLDDYARPLSARGAKAVPEIAAYLRRESLVPDLILCSSAVRTRATLALLLAGLDAAAETPAVRHDDALYLAASDTILGLVRETAPAHARVMVIGHNPGLHALALELVGSGEPKLVAALATKFPTAAMAVLTFDAAVWSDIRPAAGHLDRFVTPRRLTS